MTQEPTSPRTNQPPYTARSPKRHHRGNNTLSLTISDEAQKTTQALIIDRRVLLQPSEERRPKKTSDLGTTSDAALEME
ncbi:unnamed protein product [Brassica napus]|uniref:(rape) hypothetical protein n=1 Tax=Brassica napus TaxID=3708 RepID=A0A816IBH4_BRANA|nr:unnamed protein product [Brassica napus]